MKCPNCAGTIDQDARFCDHCGTPLAAAPASPGAGRTVITLGRGPHNTVTLDLPQVSWEHARLSRDGGGVWWLEDLGSTNGTFVNDRSRPVRRERVKPEDTLYLGSCRLAAARLLGADGPPAAPRPVSIRPDRPLLMGRDPKADIHLDFPQVSWHHARLEPDGKGSLVLRDLGSSNGTWVNGERITSRAVGANDLIGLGSCLVRLNAENKVVARDYRGNVRLDAEDITLTVPTRHGPKDLLKQVNFTVYPSEFVGLMGLSGAGKTTLFLTLNGYLRPSSGVSRLNGLDLHRHYGQFRDLIGYVPQEDVLHNELTVEEALTYTARLRLPADTSAAEIRVRIEKVLTRLGLIVPAAGVDVRATHIGSAEKKGISGGQRKRVNLAMELLTDPGVLFLDEPTSGLSAPDTLVVMEVLRGLADEGKCIILTLHMPDIESYRKMDNVIILDEGRLVYYGPAWPDSLTFFNPDRPAAEVIEHADSGLKGLHGKKELEGWTGGDWAERYAASRYRREYVEERRGDQRFRDEDAGPRVGPYRPFFHPGRWWTLCRRALTIKRKDLVNSAILLAQAPIIAALLVLVFGGQENAPATPLFLLAVSALWLGTSNAAREVVSERAIYLRERMAGLGIPEYLASKFAVFSLFCLIQCALLTVITLAFLDIKAQPAAVFALILEAALTGVGLGLCISSAVVSQAAALALVPVAILPMVILGGAMMPLPRMKDAAAALAQAMPSRWAYETLIQVESAARGVIPPATDTLVKTVFDSWAAGLPAACMVLAGFLALFMGAAACMLKRRDPV